MYSNYGVLFNTCKKYKGTALVDSTRFFPQTSIKVESVYVSSPAISVNTGGSDCSSCSGGATNSGNTNTSMNSGSNGKLANILDPRFNLKQAAHNCLLLEDHLFQKDRRCMDCITKHFALIEAFLDEAITLDKPLLFYAITTKAQGQIRNAIRRYATLRAKSEGMSDKDFCDLAQEVRIIRKPLCQQFACFA